MRQLPGLLLTNATRNGTGQVVLKELDARLERIKTALATGKYPDTSGGESVPSSIRLLLMAWRMQMARAIQQ